MINVSRVPRLIIVDERDKRGEQLNALVARGYVIIIFVELARHLFTRAST